MEKYAVLSDIHSNIYALEAVVTDAKSQGVTQFINLGDILYGPIAPKATYKFLKQLGAITISGNQDRQIYQTTIEQLESNPTMQFICEELGEAPLMWLSGLPFDAQITPDIYACHGTPSDDLTYLLEDISSGDPKLRSDQQILSLLSGNASPIILCGHTHLPRKVELSTGQIVINPGSVGLQAYTDEEPVLHSMQNFTPQASYVILQKTDNQAWDIEFCRVDYDVCSAVECAKSNSRLDWVHYLQTGKTIAR